MAQGVKALAAKPGKLSSISGSKMVEREATPTGCPLTSPGGRRYPSDFTCTHALPHLSMLILTQCSRSSNLENENKSKLRAKAILHSLLPQLLPPGPGRSPQEEERVLYTSNNPPPPPGLAPGYHLPHDDQLDKVLQLPLPLAGGTCLVPPSRAGTAPVVTGSSIPVSLCLQRSPPLTLSNREQIPAHRYPLPPLTAGLG